MELDRTIVGVDGNPEFTNLPRKMNVTVTGCLENCTHNESQDIALVPATKLIEGNTRAGFHVLVGGKMGSGGFTIASNLGWFIEPQQAVEVVIAIITFFRDEGARESRTKARLAFLLQEWGVDRFRAELIARLGWHPLPAGQDARASHHRDHLGTTLQRQPNLYAVGVNVTVGRIRHEPLRELARLADVYGTGEVRLTIGQNAILINIPQHRLEALLREPLLKELSPEPSRFVRGLVSCTGVQYCNLAVIETKARAVNVAHALEQRLGPDGEPLTMHWSGCPAACGNHLAADIGLRGMKVNVGGKSVDAVAIYVGGRTGPNAKVAQPIMEMVPCDEALPDVLATIVKHLELFKQVEPLQTGDKDRVLMIPAGAPDDVLWHEPINGAAEQDLAEASLATAQSVKIKACRAAELREGVGRLVSASGTSAAPMAARSLALFRVGERIVAMDAECPHAGGALCEGRIEAGCVVCPLHDYPFELATGRCTTQATLSVRIYPVTVEQGDVYVEVDG
jgi:sulfite reductase beta subunit-like hemoprotein/nitrite reductase/ring-hydroxylating ferredoxin subunit